MALEELRCVKSGLLFLGAFKILEIPPKIEPALDYMFSEIFKDPHLGMLIPDNIQNSLMNIAEADIDIYTIPESREVAVKSTKLSTELYDCDIDLLVMPDSGDVLDELYEAVRFALR